PKSPRRVDTSKVDRNEPCPCGSGKKFKKCGMINTSEHQRLISQTPSPAATAGAVGSAGMAGSAVASPVPDTSDAGASFPGTGLVDGDED
ncbi:MAG: SEC-C metal-binding domain-containing protein, partial [Actinomycetota bacterium]|nr:SEC-C metal-binding domain-containing protein [Actinomycetota bacterium]